MKCAILLTLVALTSATPLTGWGGVRTYPSGGMWGLWSYQTPHKEAAQQVAHEVTQEAIHDQLAHTNAAIRNLQWQLQQHPYGVEEFSRVDTPYRYNGVGTAGPYGAAHELAHQVVHRNEPVVAAEAIEHLQDDIHHQQSQIVGLGHPGSVTHQLHNTVEAGVEAQLAAGDVHRQHGVYEPTVPAGVFQSRLQKLIDEHNQQEIENQITHHHHWAQQLHHQQEFVSQQKQQIEAQQVIVQRHGSPDQVHQLEQARHHLEMQEYHLIEEQLAHHLAILQLQQALVHKEHQVLQDTVAEHIHRQAVRGSAEPFWQTRWSY